jgi:thiol-disulfide isomerase/thioredoxin
MSDHEPSSGGARRKRRDSGIPRPPRIYSVIVGLVFAVIIIVALVTALRSSDRDVLGAGADEGRPVVQFAIPDARGELTGDANIAQDDCEVAGIPCPEDKERTPACEVDLPGAIRVCDLFDRPLVISFWFTRGGDCEAQQDVFDAVYRRYRDRVNFLGINARDDRDDVAELISDRGWTHPVGLDADGALFDLFRVGGCPTFVYAYPGGIVEQSTVGELDEAELSANIDQLLAGSAKRAERVR